MQSRLFRWSSAVAIVLALGACGGDGSSTAATTGNQAVKGVSVPAQISVVTATE
ncbi:MAG: hypothetical protein R3E83_24510 [Burkholderiaceae bacterium]